jgi:hypothetical protein
VIGRVGDRAVGRRPPSRCHPPLQSAPGSISTRKTIRARRRSAADGISSSGGEGDGGGAEPTSAASSRRRRTQLLAALHARARAPFNRRSLAAVQSVVKLTVAKLVAASGHDLVTVAGIFQGLIRTSFIRCSAVRRYSFAAMNRRFDDIMTGGDRTERIVVVTLEHENQLPMQQHGRQQKNNGKLNRFCQLMLDADLRAYR